MRQAALVALCLAATLFAEEAKLTVRVELPGESLLEGERADARFQLKNAGTSRLVILAIEPEDDAATLGGCFSRPLEGLQVEDDTEGGTITVRSGTVEASAPRVFAHFVDPHVVDPGVEYAGYPVRFKAPSGHLYAIHFRVSYLSLDHAVAEHRLYVTEEYDPWGTDPVLYRCVDSLEDVSGFPFNLGYMSGVHPSKVKEPTRSALLRLDGPWEADLAHAALAVEVKLREFSFAAAAKEVGVVPDAATWFQPGGLWALTANGKTWLVAEGKKTELHGDYVQFLTDLDLSGVETIFLAAPEDDAFAGHLRSSGAKEADQKDGQSGFVVAVRDLPELLQKADELGFAVTQGGWKRRE